MIATQELVVPKSIPITSPASVLFHLEAVEAYALRAGLDDLERAAEVIPRRRPSWSAIVWLLLFSCVCDKNEMSGRCWWAAFEKVSYLSIKVSCMIILLLKYTIDR